MMRRVTMIGIAAMILLQPIGAAHAGLFGGGAPADREESDIDRGANRSYDRAPRDEEPRSPHGMRVREVGRRAKADDDDAPPRVTERDSSRYERESAPRDAAPRDEELPRSARRRAEASAEDGLTRENGSFDKKMQDLHRQLEEAEQAENPRKIKAIKWMIEKEEQRHEKELASPARAVPSRTARRSTPSYEPPDRDEREDREPAPSATSRYRSEDRDERPVPRRSPSMDEDRPRRDEPPARFARADRDEPEVSNPLKERSRRRGEDATGRSRGRSDRDEDEQDGPRGPGRSSAPRFSNAERVAKAEGSIRRY